jgi:hypothetical protein
MSPLQEASETYLKDILGFEERPLVSTDYINDPRSGIVDALSTQVGAMQPPFSIKMKILEADGCKCCRLGPSMLWPRSRIFWKCHMQST